jgi:hypothetical protein
MKTMFIQFRHVESNEHFYHLPSLVSIQYKKVNHSRGLVIGSCGLPYKGRAAYRHFKPSTVVLVERLHTPESAWMEVKCNHESIPFDNDQQCIKCGHIGREA